MELQHPTLINVPTAAIVIFSLLLIIQQRHYVLEFEEQRRINQQNLLEHVALMNF